MFVYLFLFIYSHGQEFYDHGLFNFLGSIIIIIICIPIILLFTFLIYLIKINLKLFYSFLLLYTCIYIYSYYCFYLFFGCEDWKKGLNNTYIENKINKYSCQIKFPKFCHYKIGKYLLDITKTFGIKCLNNSKTKLNILKFSKSPYINNKTNIIGFPLTNRNIMCLKRTGKLKDKGVRLFTRLNLIDMENKELLKRIGKENFPEIIVDYSNNPYGKMHIKLKFNETLSKERKKLEKKSKTYSNNIMILYFDSISRSTSIRQLKKTLNFFEKFMFYKGNFNIKYPLENYHSFQFLKYHAFIGNTPGNYPKLFYHNKIRITKYLKEKGYVTAFSNDICHRDSCYLPHDLSKDEICDHEFLLCDPNRKKINSMYKRCLYDKINFNYQYEYGFQFWTKYKKNRKFLLIVNNDGHEGTLEVIKYDDDIIFNFLNKLYNRNLFKGYHYNIIE